jgi:AcrR family transcriptional regulator
MRPKSTIRPYHHGDLRTALVAAAVDAIEEGGATAMSLRDVARRAGVTHTAAAYHFGDKAGLLAAVAIEGYRQLAADLLAAREQQRSFLEMGIAYVRFALSQPAYFEVMYHPGLYDASDPAVRDARAETAALLYGSRDATNEQTLFGIAAWSIVHGFATLWRTGNIPAKLGKDPEEIARAVASHLRVPRSRRG